MKIIKPINGALLGASATLMALVGMPAYAQSTGATVEEIVVTAARREQNLQDISTVVSVIGGEDITAQNLQDIAQIASDLPSVNINTQPGGYSINMRGLASDGPANASQGAVSLQFDGIYTVNSEGTKVGFYDVDRIEVLYGPQSTRYGPNALGGVINVISNSPEIGDDSGKASLGLGNYNLYRGEFAQNITLSDKLAVRIAGAAVDRASYYKPEQGDNVAQSFRIKALYEATDTLTLNAQFQRDHIGGMGSGGNGAGGFPIYGGKIYPYVGDSINDLPDPWAVGYEPVTGLGLDHNSTDITQQSTLLGFNYDISDQVSVEGKGSYTTIDGTLRACTHQGAPFWYQGVNTPPPVDLHGTCNVVHPFDPFEQKTAELRFYGGDDGGITWNLGLYYWDYIVAGWEEGVTDNIPGPEGATSRGTTTNAIYGEMTYPLSDSLRLNFGGRYSKDTRVANFGPDNFVLTPDRSADFSNTDFRLALEWDVAEDSLAYASVSTGYRPGEVSFNSFTDAVETSANEQNTAFEIGSKNRFMDGRLQLNANLFYYIEDDYKQGNNYSGFEVTLPDDSVVTCGPGGNPYAECDTPALSFDATTLGLELDTIYQITPFDRIGVSATFLDAKFNDDLDASKCARSGNVPQDGQCYIGVNPVLGGPLEFLPINGLTLAHAPKLAANLAYDHLFALKDGGEWSVGGSMYYTTEYTVHPVKEDATLQPSYYMLNMDAMYTSADGEWTVSIYGKNLNNYAVKRSVLPFSTIGEPRTYGVVFSKYW